MFFNKHDQISRKNTKILIDEAAQKSNTQMNGAQ